jgi:hypothetical protein
MSFVAVPFQPGGRGHLIGLADDRISGKVSFPRSCRSIASPAVSSVFPDCIEPHRDGIRIAARRTGRRWIQTFCFDPAGGNAVVRSERLIGTWSDGTPAGSLATVIGSVKTMQDESSSEGVSHVGLP